MSLYEIKQPFGVPVVANDAPRRRVIPPMASLEATLAAMKADAERWKHRKSDAWGEGMAVKPERLTKNDRVFWTPEKETALADEIIATLERNGPMTMADMRLQIPAARNRHKLRAMLTELRRAGKVTVTQGKRHEWQVAG